LSGYDTGLVGHNGWLGRLAGDDAGGVGLGEESGLWSSINRAGGLRRGKSREGNRDDGEAAHFDVGWRVGWV